MGLKQGTLLVNGHLFPSIRWKNCNVCLKRIENKQKTLNWDSYLWNGVAFVRLQTRLEHIVYCPNGPLIEHNFKHSSKSKKLKCFNFQELWLFSIKVRGLFHLDQPHQWSTFWCRAQAAACKFIGQNLQDNLTVVNITVLAISLSLSLSLLQFLLSLSLFLWGFHFKIWASKELLKASKKSQNFEKVLDSFTLRSRLTSQI